MKYLVKYNSTTAYGTTIKTRFFTTNDIENSWRAFQSFTEEKTELVDITILDAKVEREQ